MRKCLWVLIFLSAHLFILINLRFTAWPEMFSYPYLLNNGFTLYRDFVHPYPPLLTWLLALSFQLLGYKLIVLQIFTWSLVLSSDILIFLIVEKITKSYKLAAISLFFYIFIQPFLEGNQLWFDLATVTPLLLATYFLIAKRTDRNIFWSGLFFGLASLVKQTAFLYLVSSILYLLWKERNIRKIIFLLLGPLGLGVLLLLRLITDGIFVDFFNWVVVYPLQYWTKFPGYVQMSLSQREVVMFALVVLPVMAVLLARKYLILVSLTIVSLITVYPRFSFFHLQPALAFIAIVLGLSISKLKITIKQYTLYAMLVFFIIFFPVLKRDWQKQARFYSAEDLTFAEKISEEVTKDDGVYLLGPHSGLYVLAERLPPKPWLDNFGWYYEIPQVSQQVIKSWEKNPPAVIFWQEANAGNWFDLGSYRPKKVTEWIKRNYTNEGVTWDNVSLWRRKN